jgi:hypothetical protein
MTAQDPNSKSSYRRPPSEHKFKPGHSGNPKGRPKGTRNLKTDFEELLSGTVLATINGKRRQISRQELLLLNLWENAAGKDIKAARTLLEWVFKLIPPEAHSTTEQPASPSDQAIVENYLQRNGFTKKEPTDER